MLRSRILIALVAGLSMASAPPLAPSLVGIVHDARNKPVAGAWIELRRVEHGAVSAADFAGPPAKSMRSATDGSWSFPELGDGTWLLTAVASPTPHTDQELQALAAPPANGRTPADVAIARLLRRIDAQSDSWRERIDLGLSPGPAAAHPLHGRITGSFEPEKYGYVLQITPTVMMSGGGSVSFSGDEDTPSPTFTEVPDADGRFDFGTHETAGFDTITVERMALKDSAKAGTVFTASVSQLGSGKDGVEIDLNSQHVVKLMAVAADGHPTQLAEGEMVQFRIWDDRGLESNMMNSLPVCDQVFTKGSYLVQAKLRDMTSAVTVVKVDGAETPAAVSLALAASDSYTVHFVDEKGAPLAASSVKLGPADADIPRPCRIPLVCKNGDVKLIGIAPGTYQLEFTDASGGTFTQKVELGPKAAAIVVKRP